MIPEAVLYYPINSVAAEVVAEGGVSADHHHSHYPSQLYDDVMEASFGGGTMGSEPQLRSLLYSLSILKQKVDEIESLASTMILTTQESPHQPAHTHAAVPFASIGNLVQEIVVTASSMLFNCQQMTLGSPQTGNNNINNNNNNNNNISNTNGHTISNNNNIIDSNNMNNNNERYYSTWYNDAGEAATCSSNQTATTATAATNGVSKRRGGGKKAALMAEAYHLVEPEAEDLVAKFTHYCQICGKGFKRDANLRMHMRAHGDVYKSSTALSNPLKKEEAKHETSTPRKYSCPQLGCRWNKNHLKFQPLKSIVCVKNHYKRSHCPKLYVCKRCNRKQFSVLSDLRTHEKHCGVRKWQCSCGTTFSRKDKLMGHVALFVGHSAVVNPRGDNNLDFHNQGQSQFQDIYQVID